jgi:hypothetical protein
VGTSGAPAPFPRRGVLLHVPVKITGPTAALALEHVGRVSGPTNVSIFDRCAKFVRDAWRDMILQEIKIHEQRILFELPHPNDIL